MSKKIASTLAWLGLLGACGSACAFTPVGGLWGFTEELNGKPGRGFQLVVENDVLVFYYYGYDSDGRSNYLFASGSMTANTFSGQLLSCKGGTVMGAPYQQANCVNGPGTVRLTFQSGEKGTITLPGEAAKPINRFNFGYADGPDAMLGEFMFAYKATTFNKVDFYTLTVKTGFVTKVGDRIGTGMVANSNYTFGCEYFPNSTLYRSVYLCVESNNNSANDDNYRFRMVGDRGSGTASWRGNTGSSAYPLQVLRLATTKGVRTAPYNESETSLMTPKSVLLGAVDAPDESAVDAKAGEPWGLASGDADEEAETLFARNWAEQARAILNQNRHRAK